MAIKNIEGMSERDIQRELDHGARFVVFQYVVSVLIMTFRRGSDIYLIRPGESTASKSLPYTLLTLFFGWWGFPWGPIFSIGALATNVGGGKDVTAEILAAFPAFSERAPAPAPLAAPEPPPWRLQ